MMSALSLRVWTLSLSVRLFRLMRDYSVDPVLKILALIGANEIVFKVAIELG